MRKLQGVTVTSEMIGDLCRGAVPSTAKFLHAYFDNERNAFVGVFEDESFEETPEGGRVPIDVYAVRVPDFKHDRKVKFDDER